MGKQCRRTSNSFKIRRNLLWQSLLLYFISTSPFQSFITPYATGEGYLETGEVHWVLLLLVAAWITSGFGCHFWPESIFHPIFHISYSQSVRYIYLFTRSATNKCEGVLLLRNCSWHTIKRQEWLSQAQRRRVENCEFPFPCSRTIRWTI